MSVIVPFGLRLCVHASMPEVPSSDEFEELPFLAVITLHVDLVDTLLPGSKKLSYT